MQSSKQIKSKKIVKILERLYPETPIPLKHIDEFTLLVAVLLSAQCTDERVNKITPLLFEKASNSKEMVKLGQKSIEKIISFVKENDGIEYSEKIMKELVIKASNILDMYPKSDYKKSLEKLLSYTISREI